MNRARRRQLIKEAHEYAGTLVYEVTKTYEAWADYPEEEQTFINEYLRALGSRFIKGGRGEAMLTETT